MKAETRKPRTFHLDAPASTPATAPEKPAAPSRRTASARPRKPRVIEPAHEITLLPESAVDEAYREADALTPPLPEPVPSQGFGWGRLALGAFSALIALAAGLALDAFIRDLFARYDWLGWTALALTAIGILAVLILAAREILAMARLQAIQHLREEGEKAKRLDDLQRARKTAAEIAGLYVSRPETARGRLQLLENGREILDGADLIHLVERDLLRPLDQAARRMVMNSAKRVSVVTAVSPRALIDVGYVLYENMRLIRAISFHYGGRPGIASSFRLVRRVLTHLAATGAVAIGDSLVQQLVGHGIAARLSARLGEGVVNGLLTARVGIAAIDVCRPLAFDEEKRPGAGEFLSELLKTSPGAGDTGKA